MKYKIGLVILFIIIFASLVSGCALFESDSKQIERPGVETAENLEVAFNRGSPGEIMKLIHPQAEISPPDLRAQMRETFRNRRGIKLSMHSRVSRTGESTETVHLVTTWNLTWRLQEDGRIQRRRGETVFELHSLDGQWLIYNQSGAQLLGSIEPGECLEGC